MIAPIPPTEFFWLIFDIETRSYMMPLFTGWSGNRNHAGRYSWAQAAEVLTQYNTAIAPTVALLPDL